MPSGHEFNSFVLGLYNAAGPGQPLGDDLKARVAEIKEPTDIMILVSLTCTMCPETVLSAQRMSVPCIVINRGAVAGAEGEGGEAEQKVEFGKKSIPQMLELVGA